MRIVFRGVLVGEPVARPYGKKRRLGVLVGEPVARPYDKRRDSVYGRAAVSVGGQRLHDPRWFDFSLESLLAADASFEAIALPGFSPGKSRWL